MNGFQFFDAHCYTGRYKTFRSGSFYTTDDLIEQMDHYGIVEALVTHAMSRELHPLEGNAAVIEETRDRGRLHPCWALLPPRSNELPPPDVLIPEMVNNGVKAVRIFYASYSFPISEWSIGNLLEQLEAHRVPTFIDPNIELDTWEPDKMDLNSIDSLCSKHPYLPVIISEARIRSSNRALYQLMERHDNLRIELSGYWGYHAIEFITREFGADRLLFGTRLPVRDPGCAICQITYSDISYDDKKRIAGSNLRELLGGVK